MFSSTIWIPASRAMSNTTARVTPASAPAAMGGVTMRPSRTMKMLSPVHSAT